MDKSNYIVVFNSKNHAFLMESMLKKLGYRIELFQAPKYLTKSCTMAIKINNDALDLIKSKINSRSIDVYRIYKYYMRENKMVYEII